jgi:guanylate kinase
LRGSETDESLQARLNKSTYEMTFKNHFENIIINENFAIACKEVEKIVEDFLNN